MRSSRDGRRRGRPVLRQPAAHSGAGHRPGAVRGLAIDLGSSGARAWVPGRGLVACGPPGWEDHAGRPVRRGRIVDAVSCAGLLGRLADTALGDHRQDSVIVLSHPVLAGREHRTLAGELLAALGASGALVLNSASAVAASAGVLGSGPALVVDMGAELTEVALLVDGRVVDARQADAGLSDLEPRSLSAQLVRSVLDMITSMWREDQHGAVRGALRRGPVLAGGGALRHDVTDLITGRLGVPVRIAPDPSTAVVRGAALILGSVPGPAGADAAFIRPVRLT
ncbi:rod shape-determining protein [Streptomyces sp. QL37]|uniref:rod shape-determining protein n=1 Tax=Streptomyces sp. QL37 TaxID=2093747 RepID=UPI000CF26D4F|nr:rod shape-determining protein [Streptomyces sp. QL37]PPQ56172.1 rod shape-determining protein MreC [Streptomyces sp. QL37]